MVYEIKIMTLTLLTFTEDSEMYDASLQGLQVTGHNVSVRAALI